MSVLMDLHKDHVPSLGVGRDSTRDGGERIGVDNCILCSHELGQLFLQLQVDLCTRHNTFTINIITSTRSCYNQLQLTPDYPQNRVPWKLQTTDSADYPLVFCEIVSKRVKRTKLNKIQRFFKV